jgi:hypothetical protein
MEAGLGIASKEKTKYFTRLRSPSGFAHGLLNKWLCHLTGPSHFLPFRVKRGISVLLY